MAAVEATKKDLRVSGRDLLVAAVAGFEVGPRAGIALYGPDMLTRGWHSGPIFGKIPTATSCVPALTTSRLSGVGRRGR